MAATYDVDGLHHAGSRAGERADPEIAEDIQIEGTWAECGLQVSRKRILVT